MSPEPPAVAPATETDGHLVRQRSPFRRRLILGALALVAAGVVTTRWLRHETATAAVSEEPRDVPREEAGAIVISDTFRQRAGITFAAVTRGPLTPVVKVVGTVELDPRRVTAIGTGTPGFVRRVFKLEGDDVRAGDPLAHIESAELGKAQANVASAEAEQNAARINARREAALLGQHLTTARESEEASATLASRDATLAAARQGIMAMGGTARGPLGLRILRSPISGHVVEALISIGQSVEAHKLAFRVANLDSVWIELEVFERTVGLVRAGDVVEVVPMSDSKRHIAGKVAHVGEVIDLASRSTDVRVEVDNKGHLLRPGQSVSAVIHLSGPRREALTVPSEAVTYVDNEPTVFLATTPNRIVPTKIRVGLTDGTREEVLSGLGEGTQVVESGVFAIKSELFR